MFLFREPPQRRRIVVELFDGGRWEVPRYHMALFQSLADLIPASSAIQLAVADDPLRGPRRRR